MAISIGLGQGVLSVGLGHPACLPIGVAQARRLSNKRLPLGRAGGTLLALCSAKVSEIS
jgi:hypothetical protein